LDFCGPGIGEADELAVVVVAELALMPQGGALGDEAASVVPLLRPLLAVRVLRDDRLASRVVLDLRAGTIRQGDLEQIAAAVSAAHPGFKPVPVASLLEELKVANAAQLCTSDGLYLRLWPHRHGTDGFFASVWIAA
jgi:hypothetical protein